MNKTVKNLLLVFTLVCIIALVVFTIELFILNRGTGGAERNDDESGVSLSGNTDDEAEGSADSPQTPPPSNALPPVQTGQPPRTQPAGRRYELLYSINETLVLYADEELFEHDTQMEMADMFTYIGDDGTASLLVTFASMPFGAEREAETFLNNYLEGNESAVSGEAQIKGSSLSGVFVVGVNDGETFEAWIHSISDNGANSSNDIGIAFVIRYRNDEQKNALYAVLDTLEIVRR